ncbi:MAG: FtsX-like permease family protein [Candidatus Bathyarchaeia archaeon]|jgi:ABC-type lipoprotein release transport system permease subunit
MKAGDKRVHLGYAEALRLGNIQLLRRLDRSALNIASIALGLSFYASLLLTDTIYRTYESLGGANVSVEATYYWLVAIALTVSVVGITNAMLISVQERVKEIGTMKCLGALDRHIVLLFLIEALLQGLVGGVIGYAIGLIAAILSTGFSAGYDIILKVPAAQNLTLFASSLALAVALSTTATIYPAYRASKLDPVEALRYDL